MLEKRRLIEEVHQAQAQVGGSHEFPGSWRFQVVAPQLRVDEAKLNTCIYRGRLATRFKVKYKIHCRLIDSRLLRI